MFRYSQSLMLRLLLVAVYSAFFIVQIYLDASTVHSFPHPKSGKVCKAWMGKEKFLKASTSPNSESINILVNKRFHPENAVSVSYNFTIPQPVFVSKTELTMLVTFPHVLTVLADSLRAPPAA